MRPRVHHDLAVEGDARAPGGDAAKGLHGVCARGGVLDERVGVLHLLALAERGGREAELRALAEAHGERRAGRLCAAHDGVQAVAGALPNLRRERVEQDALEVELLQAVVLQRGARAEVDRDRAGDEARLRAGAHVSLDQLEPCTRRQHELEARIGGAGLLVGAGEEHQLDAQRLRAGRRHADADAAGGEGCVEQREALITLQLGERPAGRDGAGSGRRCHSRAAGAASERTCAAVASSGADSAAANTPSTST